MKKFNRSKINPSLTKSQDIKQKPVLSQNNAGGSSALISTMKMELSSIKHDVQKLMNDDTEVENISESTKEHQISTLNIDSCKRQNELLKNKCQKITKELTEGNQYQLKLEDKILEIQGQNSILEGEKLKLESENSKLENQKTKLQKEQAKHLEFKQKYLKQNTHLETQNARLLSEIDNLKAKAGKSQEGERWKEAWVELSSQVTLLEQELKLKQADIETKDQEILQLGWQLQDFKENSKQSNQKSLSKIEDNEEKLEQMLKQNQQLKKSIEQINRKLKADSQQFQRCKEQNDNKVNNIQNELQKYRNQNQILGSDFRNLQNEKSRLEQRLRSTIEQSRISFNNSADDLQRHLSEIDRLKVKLLEQQALNLKLEDSISISQANAINSAHHLKQAQLLHEINQKNNEIIALKAQLEESKKALNFVKTQNQTDKIKVVTGEKNIKNHFEIQLLNKKSELETIKRKMDALNKKVDSRTNELRQKDQFILNTIINKVNREATQTEVEYIKVELDKHFSISLGEKLTTAETEIEELKNHIQKIKTNQ